MGRKLMPPCSSHPESIKLKLGMALSCACDPAATPTAIDAASATTQGKEVFNIAYSPWVYLFAIERRTDALDFAVNASRSYVPRPEARDRSCLVRIIPVPSLKREGR